MTKLVVPGRESNSVQRLIRAAKLIIELGNNFTNFLDFTTFCTSRDDSKVVPIALWNRHPTDVRTNLSMTPKKLADQLENDSTSHAATTKLALGPAKGTGSAVNRLISSVDCREFIVHAGTETDLSSLFPDG